MAPSAHSPSYSPAYSPARTRIHLRIRILRRYGTGTAARASSIPATLSSATFSQRTCSVSIRHINFSFTTNLNLQLLTSCHWLATVGAQHLHAGSPAACGDFSPHRGQTQTPSSPAAEASPILPAPGPCPLPCLRRPPPRPAPIPKPVGIVSSPSCRQHLWQPGITNARFVRLSFK